MATESRHPFLQLLQEKIVVFDGAMGTNIQRYELSADDFGGLEGCNEYLVVTRPDVIEEIHASFLTAGCDAIETDSFGSSRVVLAEYGLEEQAYDLNRRAAELAKRVAADFSTPSQPRFVVGSIGPTTKLPTLGHISFADMKEAYVEQVSGLVDGGVDVLLVETCQDILQAKAAVVAIQEVLRQKRLRLPVMVQVTIESTGTMLLGTEIGAALAAIEPYDVDVFGMNCATGPAEMSDHVRFLAANSPFPISVIPNAGIPENVGGQACYRLTPEELAQHQRHFAKDLGVNIVGGCCGTTAEHLKAVVEAVADLTPKPRQVRFEPSVSSLYTQVTLHQEPPPLIVGERTNANGSKLFRELLLKDDYDGMVNIAREQSRGGAHVLDVCVAYVGRDEVRDMKEVIRRFNSQVQIPLMIDSTEPPAIEAALELISGRAIVNSINLEDGEERLATVLSLCKKFGAAVIALTIDEEGMAKTAERKVEIARRIYDLAVGKYGLRPQDLIFDTLTFTLGSGDEEFRRAGIETLEAIKRIKNEFPGVWTLLGVSNISFGLAPALRHVLNSVFLHTAIEYGLDAAIVNAARILPLYKINEEERELCRQLIFDERRKGYDPLVALMSYFEKKGGAAKTEERATRPASIEEALKRRIIDGDKTGLEEDLDRAMEKYTPLEIINEILLDGMRVVGELFGSGEMQLPFVLQSAETMKAAVSYLERFMKKEDSVQKGTMVIATVKGDVHDIGKNLVDIILTNNGYRVINLGIKVPIETILQAATEHKADAIGMSGLLVKSTAIMKENLEVLSERGITIPVVLGGAALTRRFVEVDLRSVYAGVLDYAPDAFAGLRFMDRVTGQAAQVGDDPPEAQTEEEMVATGAGAKFTEVTVETEPEPLTQEQDEIEGQGRPPSVSTEVDIPQAPFWGSKVVENIPLGEVFEYVNDIALIRGQWQIKRGKRKREDYERFVREKVRPDYEDLKRRCIEERLLDPKVVYGYFPVQSEGNDVIVYREDQQTEWLRFTFPRQKGRRHLCIADFFASVDSGRMDVLGAMVVTVGERAAEFARTLYEEHKYREYLYFHGLSVETAEALAEYWHKRIRRELGIDADDAREIRKLFAQGYRGARYSFGYPACPDLRDQVKLFEMLRPERIGVSLTEGYQMVPEQSTSAIIVHHPQATYFNVD
jgi:5-methyltetrahydrofolate--homocysteine methyltransferase